MILLGYLYFQKIGHSGIVRNVKGAITVESGRQSFDWHPSTVQLVAKGGTRRTPIDD